MSFRNIRRTFPEYLPVLRSVDRFPVDLQPFSHFSQNMGVLVGDRAVRFRADVQEQRAVFADHIHQVQNNIRRILVVIPDRVSPGIFRHRGIVLPEVRRNVIQLSSFQIIDRASKYICVKLCVDRSFRSPLLCQVIVKSSKFPQIGLPCILLDPPVKEQKLRLISLNQLTSPDKPVLHKFFRRRIIINAVHVTGNPHSRTIQAVSLPLVHIGFRDLPASVEEPVMLRTVGRRSEHDAGFLCFRF